MPAARRVPFSDPAGPLIATCGAPDIDQAPEPAPTGTTRHRRAGLSIVLASGMALCMVPGPVIGVLSRFLIDDLGLTRTEIGAVATGHAFVIMAVSLPLGYLTDRIGGRWMLVLMLGFVFLGLMTMSWSWGLWSLFVFAGIAGVPAGGGNSATNTIIVENVPPGSRGWITGIKQSGVQMGVFAAGATLPALAGALGWRPTLALSSLVALVAIGITLWVVPAGRPRQKVKEDGEPAGPIPRAVWWISAYGVTMGIGVAVYSAFLPLYGQERLGFSVGLGGMVLAVSGGVGVVSRMVWGRIAERAGDPVKPLMYVGLFGLLSLILVWMASHTFGALIWVGAVMLGIGPASWMSVGMFAAISMVGPKRTGSGTAMIMLGFGLGLTIGPVIFGWAVDTTGGYDLPMAGTLVNFLLAILLMGVWRIHNSRQQLS